MGASQTQPPSSHPDSHPTLVSPFLQCTPTKNCVDAASAPFDVLEDPPVVSAITPPSAPIGGGTVVEIIGTNLGTNQSDVLAVSMGGTPCAAFLWISPSRINCTGSPACRGVAVFGVVVVAIVVLKI